MANFQENSDDPGIYEEEPQEEHLASGVEASGNYPVVTPSGAKFAALTDEEARYFEDRAERYMSEFKFVNVTDLQDIDRVLVLETMAWRWGLWLSQEQDYWGHEVDVSDLKKSIVETSKELRLMKKAVGIDKATRDKDRGSNFADFLETLRRAAKEFGVMREEQCQKSITLFQELKTIVGLHERCDELERREQHVELKDVLEWIQKVAIPEFDEIDEKFRSGQQKYWISDL